MPSLAKTPGGPRGPVPKLSIERRRRNKSEIPGERVKAGQSAYPPPEPDGEWHPTIRRVWDGLVASATSGHFFQPSDWAMAWYACDVESVNLLSSRSSAMRSQLFVTVMTDLMATEGSRRRLRVELERGEVEDPVQAKIMKGYRSALKVVDGANA